MHSIKMLFRYINPIYNYLSAYKILNRIAEIRKKYIWRERWEEFRLEKDKDISIKKTIKESGRNTNNIYDF